MPNKTPPNVFCGVYTMPSSANIRNKTKIYLSAVICITNHSVNKCVVCIQALSSHGICIRKKARHMECLTKGHAKVLVSGQVCSSTGKMPLYVHLYPKWARCSIAHYSQQRQPFIPFYKCLRSLQCTKSSAPRQQKK